MIHVSYAPLPEDKFILVTNNTLNDVVNIPSRTKPTKCNNRVGYWKIKQ